MGGRCSGAAILGDRPARVPVRDGADRGALLAATSAAESSIMGQW
jgi:hypothetical protein